MEEIEKLSSNNKNDLLSVLVHSDVASDNIILKRFDGENNNNNNGVVVPQLIDWGDASFGIRENDFTTMCDEVYGTPLWDALLEGYRKESSEIYVLNERLIFLLTVKSCFWKFSYDGND